MQSVLWSSELKTQVKQIKQLRLNLGETLCLNSQLLSSLSLSSNEEAEALKKFVDKKSNLSAIGAESFWA